MAAAQQKAEATKAKPEPAKAEVKPEAKPEAKPESAKAEAAKPAEPVKPEAAPATKPPAPPPEPSMMDMAMDNLPIIGGGLAALVLGGLGFAAMRRRRAREQDGDDIEPVMPAMAAAADDGLDFKIDVGDLNINLYDTSTQTVPSESKDGHWYDVQQKFDLAKAYQEMGDNDGAREILQEVIKEGDAEQQDQAQKLLSSLG